MRCRQDVCPLLAGRPLLQAQPRMVPLRHRSPHRDFTVKAEPSAERDAALRGTPAPTDFAAATSSRDGEFGQNGALSPRDQEIPAEGLDQEKVLRGWSALPARYQMVVATSAQLCLRGMPNTGCQTGAKTVIVKASLRLASAISHHRSSSRHQLCRGSLLHCSSWPYCRLRRWLSKV